MHSYANKILKPDGMWYKEIDEKSDKGKENANRIITKMKEFVEVFLIGAAA